MYLIHARLSGRDNHGSHFIAVDGTWMTHTWSHDADYLYVHGSTSIVLHLVAGQEVAVGPQFHGTIDGSTTHGMYSSFGITMLYGD